MSPKTVSPSGETAAMSGQQQKLVIRDRSHLELKKVQPKVLFLIFIHTYSETRTTLLRTQDRNEFLDDFREIQVQVHKAVNA